MANAPAPIPDKVLSELDPLVDEAIDAFTRDISYGVQIVAAGRKVMARAGRAPIRESIPAVA